jgi:signal recognition particle subunit SRP68
LERCLYLSYFYAAPSLKRYAQALALTQRARLHLREAESNQQLLEHASLPNFSFVPSKKQITEVEATLSASETKFKTEWFNFNGGALTSPTQTIGESDATTTKKPLFFDIALNYADVDIDALRSKAGLEVQKRSASAPSAQRVKETVEEAAPVEKPASAATSRLGSLLGSWWS